MRCERETLFRDAGGRVETLKCTANATESVVVAGKPVACCAQCAAALRQVAATAGDSWGVIGLRPTGG